MRNKSEQNIAKSVRASLTMYQKPWWARNSPGIFVVVMAVAITINSGIAAALVHSPRSTMKPQTISKAPTKCAVK